MNSKKGHDFLVNLIGEENYIYIRPNIYIDLATQDDHFMAIANLLAQNYFLTNPMHQPTESKDANCLATTSPTTTSESASPSVPNSSLTSPVTCSNFFTL